LTIRRDAGIDSREDRSHMALILQRTSAAPASPRT
jgi:hypothetical protein